MDLENTTSTPVPSNEPRPASDWLDAGRLIEKIEQVRDLAREDFHDRGLPRRVDDIRRLVGDAARLGESVKDRSPLDFLVPSMVILGLLVISMPVLLALRLPSEISLSVLEVFEPIDAAMNVVLLVLGLWFVIYRTLVERRRAKMMRMIHRFRSIVHLLDLVQLTKSIEPDREDPLSIEQRVRYLDLCSQSTSLAAKGAALLIARYSDARVVAAVNEIETVCSGISQKIWNKIQVLQTISES